MGNQQMRSILSTSSTIESVWMTVNERNVASIIDLFQTQKGINDIYLDLKSDVLQDVLSQLNDALKMYPKRTLKIRVMDYYDTKFNDSIKYGIIQLVKTCKQLVERDFLLLLPIKQRFSYDVDENVLNAIKQQFGAQEYLIIENDFKDIIQIANKDCKLSGYLINNPQRKRDDFYMIEKHTFDETKFYSFRN